MLNMNPLMNKKILNEGMEIIGLGLNFGSIYYDAVLIVGMRKNINIKR